MSTNKTKKIGFSISKIAAFVTVMLGLTLCHWVVAQQTQPRSFTDFDSRDAFAHKAQIIKQLFEVISWPKGALPDQNLTICLVGDFLYVDELKALGNEKIKDRNVTVKKIESNTKTGESCQLIYVAASEEKNANELIKWYSDQPIILVSDIPDFARKGGSMNFLLLNGKIAITANQVVLAENKMYLDLNAFNSVTIIPDKEDIPEIGEDEN